MQIRKGYKGVYEEAVSKNCDLYNEIIDLKDEL